MVLAAIDHEFIRYEAQSCTDMCIAMLKLIASHYNANCNQVDMYKYDATKALDKLDIVKMFGFLMKRGIPGIFLR